MNLRDLTLAAMSGDDLGARQWVKDAQRTNLDLSSVPEPDGLSDNARAVAAALIELLAQRQNRPPPAWVVHAGQASEPVYLLPQARTSPALRRWCEQDTPELLRARNVFAVRDYLKVA
jgi:hypothetical protein